MQTAPDLAVRIPGVLLKFLERASIAYAATRDRQLAPAFHWLSGWVAVAEGHGLEVFVARPFEASLLQNVEHSPRLAVTIEHIGPHETYQFKGHYAGSRPPDARDRQRAEACADRAMAAILQIEQRFAFDTVQLRRYLGTPALVVRLGVEEIFLQTPGPGAGRRLVPSEKP